jgi:hypothetical protein
VEATTRRLRVVKPQPVEPRMRVVYTKPGANLLYELMGVSGGLHLWCGPRA